MVDADAAKPGEESYRSLASYQRCVERIVAAWPVFQVSRQDRLRHAAAAEKVSEAILEDLFTQVLDWKKGDLAYQVGYADIVLTQNIAKYLVVEAKRPGALVWRRHSVALALGQARRYAEEQRVARVAVSDGCLLYAADIENGALQDRLCVRLDQTAPPRALWWLSVHGIYRPREGVDDRALMEQVPEGSDEPWSAPDAAGLRHPKYSLPCHCFAYVGDASDPGTWKLPYLEASGAVDVRRLPMAVQAILSNYRGARVGGIPESAMPDVLVRLAQAAGRIGKLPGQGGRSAPIYVQLIAVLKQLDRWK